jgi:hypothetical protein
MALREAVRNTNARKAVETMARRIRNTPGWGDLSVSAQANLLMIMLNEVLSEAFTNLDDLTRFAERLRNKGIIKAGDMPRNVPFLWGPESHLH